MTTFETPKTPPQFVATMLRSSIEADRLASENINDRYLREAHTHSAVNGYVAAYALQVLHATDPEAAAQLAERLDQILTAGDIGGPAYRAAKSQGHDPDQWIAESDERAARRREARTASNPT